jgi:hypothetical protein
MTAPPSSPGRSDGIPLSTAELQARRGGGRGGPRRPDLYSLRADRTGAWSDIRTGGPTAPLTRRYLTLWHDHGRGPDGAGYAHLLLPAASFGATAARAAYPGVEVLELGERVHAFRTTPGGLPGQPRATLTALAFWVVLGLIIFLVRRRENAKLSDDELNRLVLGK